MQNKANFKIGKMNISISIIRGYENKYNWTLSENKPKTKPIKANFKRDDGFSAYYTRDCHGTHRINPRSCLRLPLPLPTQVGAAGQEDAGAAQRVNARARKPFRGENGIDDPAGLGYPIGAEL
jgi:hypothetical protein